MDQGYAYNVAAVFCHIIRDGQVLLIKRTAPPEQYKYTVIGGRKERGEDLAAACRREALEETGLVLGRIEFRGVVSVRAQGRDTETLAFYFLSEDFTGEAVSTDEGALEWCGIGDSYKKEGISDYYLRITPYVLGAGPCFAGAALVDGGGAILSVDIA